jgi:hypothetical protein
MDIRHHDDGPTGAEKQDFDNRVPDNAVGWGGLTHDGQVEMSSDRCNPPFHLIAGRRNRQFFMLYALVRCRLTSAASNSACSRAEAIVS